jgi:hypothetical protein
MNDEAFLETFKAGQLSTSEFDHRAHVRAAWLMLQRYPLEEAIERTCVGIESLATHFGAASKYNRTMTEALIRLMNRAASTSVATSFDDYLQANPWLYGDVRVALAEYYSSSQLFSDHAKRAFVSPDLKPLP